VKFDNKIPVSKSGKKTEKIPTTNTVEFSNLATPPVLPKPSKEELSKSYYYKKTIRNIKTNLAENIRAYICSSIIWKFK